MPQIILRTTLVLVMLIQFPFAIANFRLQLLHNNDMHARFKETEENTDNWFCTSGKCFGSFARVKQAMNQFTEDATRRGIPTILLNSGDTFQGTPYYTLQKWKIVAPLFDILGFNVTCLGNHEFDDGIDNLVEFLNHIQTPVVACNVNVTTEKRLQVPNLMPSTILDVGGERIGVIGYVTTETMESSRTENLEILDEISCLRKEAQRLKNKGIKIIIGLGHSGIDRDKEIAEEVEELSLIVGGHSHTMMYTPKEACPSTETALEEYPAFVTQKSGKQVPIVQAYKHTKYLGRLFLEFDDNGVVVSAQGNPVLLDSSIPKDLQVNNLVEKWTNPLNDLLKIVKGYLRVSLLRSNVSALEFESNAGNLVTDAFIYHGVKRAQEQNLSNWTMAPIAIFNRGGIRADLTQGNITLADLYTMIPYADELYIVDILGSSLLEALELTVSEDDGYSILDVAGLRVVYDLDQPLGSRVSSVFVLCDECNVPHYEELKADRTYTAIINDFLLRGKDKFKMFSNKKTSVATIGKTATDVVIDYVQQLKYIYPKLEGRLTVVQHEQTNNSESAGYSILILLVIIIGVTITVLFFFYYYRYTQKTEGNIRCRYQPIHS